MTDSVVWHSMLGLIAQVYLVITGDIQAVRFDPRPLDQVKAEAEKQKAALQAQNDEVIAKVDEVINIVKDEAKKKQ
jgi:hypothetical protein